MPPATSCCGRWRRRIRRVIREVDTLARLGGDEFALLQAHTDEPEAMRLVAEPDHRGGAGSRFRIERQEIRASVSIGIASCPQAADDRRRADASGRPRPLSRQGAGGVAASAFSSPAWMPRWPHAGGSQADSTRALQQDELHLVYQPQVDLRTAPGRGCRGAGALAAILCTAWWRRAGSSRRPNPPA